jgi:tripartite-type tricarboxylate transporter receptor subunit TctC
MRISRALAALALLTGLGATAAHADDYPTRTWVVIVPFAAGDPADITGHIVTAIYLRHLGQSFVVENVGGAGDTVGLLKAARASGRLHADLRPHGHACRRADVLSKPRLRSREELRADRPGRDATGLLVVRKGLPVNNLKEFVDYAKKNENKLKMDHTRVGSVSYPGCFLLNSATGIHPTLVPFTDTAQVMSAILAGNVDCDPILGPLSHARAGTAKALAIAAKKQPDVPNFYEQGLPQFDCAPFYAVFAPRGTPKAVIDKLADALDKGRDELAVQKRFAELGAIIAQPSERGPEALAARVHAEIARQKPIVAAAKAKQ